jgi:hypothetical protein
MEQYAKGKEEPQGPRKWEAQAVRQENEPQGKSRLVFAFPSFIPVTHHLLTQAHDNPNSQQGADNDTSGHTKARTA